MPVTLFQDGRVKIELIFNAEASNVLIVNARALGEEHLDLTVMFDMVEVSAILLLTCLTRTRYVVLANEKCPPKLSGLFKELGHNISSHFFARFKSKETVK